MIIDFKSIAENKICFFCKKNYSNVLCFNINIVSENKFKSAACRFCLKKYLHEADYKLLLILQNIYKNKKKHEYIDLSLKELIVLYPEKKIFKVLSIHRIISKSENIDFIYRLVKRYQTSSSLNKELSKKLTALIKGMLNEFARNDHHIYTKKIVKTYIGPGSSRFFKN